MSMNFAAAKRTVCEVIREINDDLQGNPAHDTVLPKLREAEQMCKRMAKKLYEYNKDFDKDWWAANPNQAAKMERRLNESYLS